MKIFRICFFALLLAMVAPAHAGSDTTRIVVLTVNDMHAKIDNFPRFKSLVDSIRSQHKDVLLLSAGDIFTGNPVVDQYPEKGYPIIEMMNITGFGATALGNHEFDYGQEVLAKRIAQADFPFLSSNVFFDSAHLLNIKPYTFLTMENGIKIGILGMIQINPAGIPDTHPSKLEGISFKKGSEIAPEYKWLRDSCDVFIGLSHLGYEDDIELAKQMGTFDMIAGGHTHTIVALPGDHNGVLVVQGGSGLRFVTMTTLTLVNKKIVDKESFLLEIDKHLHTDAVLDTLLAKFNDNKELNHVIGTALNNITGKNELGSLMTDAMTSIAPLEIAFQNDGGIRIGQITKGDISIKDVYNLDPFGNEIIQFRLTTKEIKSLIVNSYNREKELDLQVSGATYTVFVNDEGYATDAIVRLPDGSIPEESRVFNVGLSSYIASSYTFDHTDEGTSLFIITAQSLINYIMEHKALDYSGVVRISEEKAH